MVTRLHWRPHETMRCALSEDLEIQLRRCCGITKFEHWLCKENDVAEEEESRTHARAFRSAPTLHRINFAEQPLIVSLSLRRTW